MIKKDINHWSKRNLTPLGRITVVKTLLSSKVTHLFISLQNLSSELITHLDRLFAQFIWRGKVDRIARKILCQDHKNAGFRMIYISSFVKALKANMHSKNSTNKFFMGKSFQRINPI